ncbi:MAG: hypothetical protein WCI22_04590 [Actinomycetota bacterium]
MIVCVPAWIVALFTGAVATGADGHRLITNTKLNVNCLNVKPDSADVNSSAALEY